MREIGASRKRSLDLLDGTLRRHETIRIEGRRGYSNDIYLSIAPEAIENVVFFPGDVQNFDHIMRRGTFKAFTTYSYEAICAHYAQRYPNANIWIIKPFLHLKGKSCYDNFIKNEDGEPNTYDTDGFAFMQLQLLMEHACTLFQGKLSWEIPLHLVGFSRGVIVMNQIITELGSLLHLSTSPNQVEASFQELADGGSISAFFERVESIEWIDGGCNAAHMAFPSNETALVLLNAFQHIQLTVFVTPYQISSPLRPWYADDLANFQDECPHLQIKEFFMHEAPSLSNHFEVLFHIG